MISVFIDEKTAELIRMFSGTGDGLALPIRDWFELFPDSFYRIGHRELAPDRDPFVLQMMLNDAECCRRLCDANLLDTPAAIALARKLFAVGQHLDIRLAHTAIEWAGDNDNRKALRRCLLLLESLNPGPRINTFLLQLLTSQEGVIRCKALEMLIRSSMNEYAAELRLGGAITPQLQRPSALTEENIRSWLQDPDPRVRANLIEFLAGMCADLEWVTDVLRDHLSDAHGRVAANSAVGLLRLGQESEATTRLKEMASHEDAGLRSSAAWAMGQLPNRNFAEVLHRLRGDTDPRVRWNALRSLKRMHSAAPKPSETASGTDEELSQSPLRQSEASQ